MAYEVGELIPMWADLGANMWYYGYWNNARPDDSNWTSESMTTVYGQHCGFNTSLFTIGYTASKNSFTLGVHINLKNTDASNLYMGPTVSWQTIDGESGHQTQSKNFTGHGTNAFDFYIELANVKFASVTFSEGPMQCIDGYLSLAGKNY